MNSYSIDGGDMDEAEAAAALAAVACLLEAEAAGVPAGEETAPAGWHSAARLITQGLIPTRLPGTPCWGSIERLRRAGRAPTGVVGQ